MGRLLLSLHAGVGFILRMYFHTRKPQFQVLDKSLHHHVLAVLAAIGVVGHAHYKLVHLVLLYKLVQTFKEICGLAVYRLARERHANLGIPKGNPYTMFTVINGQVIHGKPHNYSG